MSDIRVHRSNLIVIAMPIANFQMGLYLALKNLKNLQNILLRVWKYLDNLCLFCLGAKNVEY